MGQQNWRNRSVSGVVPLDHEDWRRLRETMDADHCHGLVVKDGEQDACGKPPVAIIDGRGCEDESFWPACAYHANRYGGTSCVPLVILIAATRLIPEADQ